MQHFLAIALVVVIAILCGSSQAFSTHPDEYFMGGAAPAVISPEPHIALLLPLQSSTFGSAANAVKEGFFAAARHEQSLPLTIKIYATTDDPLDTLITYHQALDAGAVLIIGPLTRDSVSALASSHVVEVPTLALNKTDADMILPPNLYLFGLQMENEADQIAEFAMTENRRHAIIITDDSPLSNRLQTAFAERWLAEYEHTAESVKYEDEQTVLLQFRKHTADKDNVVFLALGATKSRMIRAYLNPSTPVYATSQLFSSNNDALFNHDLNGVQFMDMPWLLQPNHPAVTAYREMIQPKSTDMERFSALGIDAFRLAAHMLQAQSADEISLDGVTGRIYFAPPSQFVREPLFAQFEKGKVILLEIQEESDIEESP